MLGCGESPGLLLEHLQQQGKLATTNTDVAQIVLIQNFVGSTSTWGSSGPGWGAGYPFMPQPGLFFTHFY